MMVDLWEPLFLDVLERGRRCNGEADQENIGLRVRQRTESVVIFLTGSIKESEGMWLITNHNGDGVVVENCWYVFTWEFVGGVRDE
jgi:tRNA-dihydrouridine synthase